MRAISGQITIVLVLVTFHLHSQVGDWPAEPVNYVYFGSPALNQSLYTNYALLQHKTQGTTFVNSPSELRFRILNTDVAILTTAGNFGIGTTTPAAKLEINGSVCGFECFYRRG